MSSDQTLMSPQNNRPVNTNEHLPGIDIRNRTKRLIKITYKIFKPVKDSAKVPQIPYSNECLQECDSHPESSYEKEHLKSDNEGNLCTDPCTVQDSNTQSGDCCDEQCPRPDDREDSCEEPRRSPECDLHPEGVCDKQHSLQDIDEDICNSPGESEMCNDDSSSKVKTEPPDDVDTSEKPVTKVNSKRSINKGKLKQPPAHRNDKSYTCIVCQKVFNYKHNLQRHFRVHINEKPTVSKVCGDKCNPEHDCKCRTEKCYTCKVCKKVFNDKNNLLQHYREHTHKKPSEKVKCNKEPSEKHCHKQSDGGQRNEKSFACDVCNRVYNDKFNLRQHYRVHTNEKPFVCDICNKGFSQKRYLSQHNLVHSKEKPYQCSVCMKGFNDKSNFNQHYLIHTNEKPFVCGVCKKAFTQKSTLQAHYLVHTNQTPFVCEICNKVFRHKCSLTRHYQLHPEAVL